MDLMEFATDPELETEGAEIKVDSKTTLWIARYNNPKFFAMQQRLSEPAQKAAGRKRVSDKKAQQILTKCMAKHILKKWTGLYIDGKEVEYSPAKCLEILSDPRFKTFKEDILAESQDIENFRLEKFEDDLGNSGGPSTTQSDGQKSSKDSSKT